MTKLANVILNVFVQGESLKICFEQFNGDKVFSTNNAGSTEYPYYTYHTSHYPQK